MIKDLTICLLMTSLVLNNWAQAFALHSYIMYYLIILHADSEGPDQTA